ncbi:MAG: hypothetical protein QNM02_21740 [Acidimicrobiia bacterium]|nr:hypothetical protein [Acidimicrobiia bacterium]
MAPTGATEQGGDDMIPVTNDTDTSDIGPRRRAQRAGLGLIASTALVAAGFLVGQAEASPADTTTVPPTGAAIGDMEVGHADIRERLGVALDAEYGATFDECMRAATGPPDRVEEHRTMCDAQGADSVALEVLYLDCMYGVRGTADTLERWVDYCRGRAELELADRD